MSATSAPTLTTPATSPAEDDAPPKEKGAWRYRAASVAVGVLLLALWEILPRAGIVEEIILPPFSDVAEATWNLFQAEGFWNHFRVSMQEIFLGFVFGTVVGLAGGVALALWEPVKRVTYPYVVAFQAIPKIVFAPLFIAWFGYGQTSKVVMALTIAFFPVLLNTMVGLKSTPEDALKLMRSLRASRWQTFKKVEWPFALPFISAGVKTALTFAVIGAIVGEFVGAREGLGFLLNAYNFQLRIDAVFAVIVVLGAIGAFLYFLVEWADRKLIFWEDRGADPR